MPRYYCDYCDTYLTHDSPSVRKQHNAGYKHKANVRIYYQQFEEQQTQSLIDQRIKEHLGQAAAYNQVGGAFNQHMLARPRLPMMPMPMGMRPPVLPRPMMPGQGYMPPPGVPQMMAPPGAPLPPPPQNGMLRPPGMAPLPGQGGGPPPNYNGLPLPPPPPYQTNPAAAAAQPSGGFNNPNSGAESPESNE
ncbi:hypothetical protein Bca4012_019083 [Brassica carinata]|uniref:U1 small nuclear ribonucleoprotein C n=1 Tax=Brassica carinata TaxID=52824 RepID=A0A8X8BDY3_BRACI|nr:hypothetical protein Bca52824_002510 [Brassica carinata]